MGGRKTRSKTVLHSTIISLLSYPCSSVSHIFIGCSGIGRCSVSYNMTFCRGALLANIYYNEHFQGLWLLLQCQYWTLIQTPLGYYVVDNSVNWICGKEELRNSFLKYLSQSKVIDALSILVIKLHVLRI